jgi:hypothetical protein
MNRFFTHSHSKQHLPQAEFYTKEDVGFIITEWLRQLNQISNHLYGEEFDLLEAYGYYPMDWRLSGQIGDTVDWTKEQLEEDVTISQVPLNQGTFLNTILPLL